MVQVVQGVHGVQVVQKGACWVSGGGYAASALVIVAYKWHIMCHATRCMPHAETWRYFPHCCCVCATLEIFKR